LTKKDETYVSAQQSAAKTDSRVPRPDGIARRSPRAQAPAHQGPPSVDRLDPAQAARLDGKPDARFGKEHRLRRRTDFVRVRRAGNRFQTRHFVVYLARLTGAGAPRLGLAVSRQIGNAVVRNRIKRRLREGFRCRLKPLLAPASALLIVARAGAAQLKTQEMAAELLSVLPTNSRAMPAQRAQPHSCDEGR